jgi:hypothetical protein
VHRRRAQCRRKALRAVGSEGEVGCISDEIGNLIGPTERPPTMGGLGHAPWMASRPQRGESICWRFMPSKAYCRGVSYAGRRALPMMAHPCSERLGETDTDKPSWECAGQAESKRKPIEAVGDPPAHTVAMYSSTVRDALPHG